MDSGLRRGTPLALDRNAREERPSDTKTSSGGKDRALRERRRTYHFRTAPLSTLLALDKSARGHEKEMLAGEGESPSGLTGDCGIILLE